MVFRENRQDRQAVGFGQGLERIQLLHFLGGDLFEGRRNRHFLDINLLAGMVFELLHCQRQHLQTGRLPGEYSDARKACVSGEWRPGHRVLVVGETVAFGR